MMQVRIDRVGDSQTPVVAIEQATANPEHWRSTALSLDWAQRGDYYPGPRAPAPRDYLADLTAPLRQALGKVFGWRSQVEVLRCFFSLSTTHAHDLNLAQRVPHVDSYDPNQIAFVHYLCDPSFGGTAFYRQRSTRFERIDERNCRAFEAALDADFRRLGEPESAYVDAQSPFFEQLHVCPAAHNRIVIFPGNLLHCADLAGVRLNPNPALGRLTVAGFLRPGS